MARLLLWHSQMIDSSSLWHLISLKVREQCRCTPDLNFCLQDISLPSYIRKHKQIKTLDQKPNNRSKIQLLWNLTLLLPFFSLLLTTGLPICPLPEDLNSWLFIFLSTSGPVIIYDNCKIHIIEPVHTLSYQFFNSHTSNHLFLHPTSQSLTSILLNCTLLAAEYPHVL